MDYMRMIFNIVYMGNFLIYVKLIPVGISYHA